jgi:phage terminase small subunit
MDAQMTPKQQRFVQEYMIDLNARQAAIRAGYSENTAAEIGYENLRKPQIASAIDAAQAKKADKLKITAEKVLRDLEEVRLLALAAGQFAPAARAIELQGKHVGMFIERRETVFKDQRMVVEAPPPEQDVNEWLRKYGPSAH